MKARITKDIAAAKELLDNGRLVAIPTETVYGLAANGTNILAIKKIFEAKGRPSNNPLILHFSGLDALSPYVTTISTDAKLLAEAFWPGPLTLLLPKSNKVPDSITAGLTRVAVRIPQHPLTQELLGILDYPLAAPSANPSGYISPTRPSHVQKQLGDKIPLILDGGPCTKGLESTILGWDDNGTPTIYRKGVITAEAIEKVLHQLPHNHQSKTLEAPGMLSSHYAPRTKTVLADAIDQTIAQYKKLKIGIIRFHSTIKGDPKANVEIVLSDKGSLEEVAKNLYAAMHELDGQELDLIVIEKAPETGIGKAINDRLQRSTTIV
ncbi:L-threonylcarbamoyladenylate synthase [uncultured Croceitalea sp.]|uniref:L-threonylcarbamoyladenylate synthase n=1 Tax=uncultured Croceitalea sp. TaxID=1798908 RepID=UPI003305F451